MRGNSCIGKLKRMNLDKIGCNLTELQNIIATKSHGSSWSFAEKDDYKNFQPLGKWSLKILNWANHYSTLATLEYPPSI